jgi:uncharacterized protein YdiU (UPF0061 family)
MSIPFDNTYATLPDRFYARQAPAPVPEARLIRVNRPLAATLGIDADWLESPEGVAVLAGNSVAEGSDPLAQAYSGHQFGGFSPVLGDGRALLLGEVVGIDGQRRDIQLKGSGRTRFSRRGDGKSALGPVLREYIVSEAMAALGVRSTRALAAVATGERVLRQEGHMPGGVFTRVAASHIRVGTFQYFRAHNDVDGLRLLADHVIARHYPGAASATNPYAALLAGVIAAQADLIAHWMSLGFIHGVMNTDNMTVSGETIDYGPCAFMDAFHWQQVFSSIDAGGRYAWSNQPDIGLWNLTRLAEALLPLLAETKEDGVKVAESMLAGYSNRFGEAYVTRFRAKLGVPADASPELIQDCLTLLDDQGVDFTQFFCNLTRVAAGEDIDALMTLFPDRAAVEPWLATWRNVHAADLLAGMRGANPVRIPRNHRVEQAIARGYEGDFAPFHRLVDGLAEPYDERPEFADLEEAPLPAEVVTKTFCGT